MPRNIPIQFRRGTSTEWTNENPVLISGEAGFDVTNDVLKIGDGSTSWTDLPEFAPFNTNLIAGTGIGFVYDGENNTLTINSSGTGGISNLVEDTSPQLGGDLDLNNNSITGVGNINTSGNIIANTGAYNALTVNSISVSVSGHTHTASDITNFNSSVSGLLPVKNISAGYDISISSVSGNYTIASTNLVHVDSKQPQGFTNRTDSRISVSGNIFTIAPTGSSYSYYNQGIKVIKTSGDSLTIPNLTQINYIHFDTINNQLSNKTTGFDFTTDIPIAYIAWNSGVSPSGQMTFFAEERHGIVMDTSTHKWIHNTFGAQYVDGLSIGDYVLGGDGSSNSHATISIGNGTLYQEDIEINITDSSSTDPFCQELSPIAQIPVYYHEGSTGQWVKNTATDYPVKYGANGPQYNLFSGGTWTIPDVSTGGQTRYFAVWILATNQIDDPIISIMGQRIDSNQGSAESNNSWGDVNLTNLPLSEVKPLYRLIFAGDSDYTNVPKCSLLSILDIRVSVISTIAGVTQNDHGSLFGLGDDDHSQYVHIDNARTINAIHTFENGLTSNGLISSSSGNFSTLQVNGTPVSVSGHIHTTGDITGFASGVADVVSTTLVAGTGITFDYNAGTDSLTINSLGTGVIYDDGTNVGIGTASPVEKLYVNGSIGNLGWRINEGAITTTGSGVGNGVAITLNAQFGTTLTTTFQYKVRLTTYGTGTTTGATYLVHYNTSTSAWVLREVGLEGNTSNHPLLAESDGELIAYTDHPTGYGIRYLVESYNTADADSTPNSMGADYHWQRLVNNLYYIDGNVSIGTTTAINRLNVEGGNIVFNDLGGNYDFRVEGDTDQNLLFTDASSDGVGIGTASPQAKLDVNGTVQFNNLVRWEYPDKTLDPDTATLGYMRLYDETGAYCGLGVSTGSFNIGSSGAINLRLLTNATERAIIDTNGNFIFNEAGNNCDFRVEGDSNQNLIFTDASTDRVGIGRSSPQYLLDIGSNAASSIMRVNTIQLRNYFNITNGDNANSSTSAAGSMYSPLGVGYGTAPTTNKSITYATNYFSSPGDAQKISMVVQHETTNNTPAYLNAEKTGGYLYSTYVRNDTFLMPINSSATFTMHIVANNNTDDTSAGWIVKGCVKSVDRSLSLVGTPTIENFADAGMSSASINIETQNGSGISAFRMGGLLVKVTGISGKTIRWVCTIDAVITSF